MTGYRERLDEMADNAVAIVGASSNGDGRGAATFLNGLDYPELIDLVGFLATSLHLFMLEDYADDGHVLGVEDVRFEIDAVVATLRGTRDDA